MCVVSGPASSRLEPREQRRELRGAQVRDLAPPFLGELDAQHPAERLHALPEAGFLTPLLAALLAALFATLLGYRQRAALVLDGNPGEDVGVPLDRREPRGRRSATSGQQIHGDVEPRADVEPEQHDEPSVRLSPIAVAIGRSSDSARKTRLSP